MVPVALSSARLFSHTWRTARTVPWNRQRTACCLIVHPFIMCCALGSSSYSRNLFLLRAYCTNLTHADTVVIWRISVRVRVSQPCWGCPRIKHGAPYSGTCRSYVPDNVLYATLYHIERCPLSKAWFLKLWCAYHCCYTAHVKNIDILNR